jgi:YVTN family beta-propeller protein
MTLEKRLIKRVVLLGALALSTSAVITRLAAAQTPSPALLITTRGAGDHSLTIANPLTMKVVGRVPIDGGGYPHEVAVSADGKLAFVTNASYAKKASPDDPENPEGIQGSFISVINLAAQKEIHRVETGVGSYPHGIVFASGKVYYTAEGYKLVGRYDPASDKIDWEQGTGQSRQHMLVVTKDLTKIFTANTDSDTVSAIVLWDSPADYHSTHYDPPPTWNVTQIPVGHGPEGIAMSPDEKEVWVAHRSGGTLSIIDVATKKVVQTLDLNTTRPLRPKFTPDGKRFVIVDGESADVLVLDTVTRKEIKRIHLADQSEAALRKLKALQDAGKGDQSPSKTHGLLISPDGSHVYVTVLGGNYIAVIDLKTFELTGRIPTGSRPEGMAWAQTR